MRDCEIFFKEFRGILWNTYIFRCYPSLFKSESDATPYIFLGILRIFQGIAKSFSRNFEEFYGTLIFLAVTLPYLNPRPKQHLPYIFLGIPRKFQGITRSSSRHFQAFFGTLIVLVDTLLYLNPRNSNMQIYIHHHCITFVARSGHPWHCFAYDFSFLFNNLIFRS